MLQQPSVEEAVDVGKPWGNETIPQLKNGGFLANPFLSRPLSNFGNLIAADGDEAGVRLGALGVEDCRGA